MENTDNDSGISSALARVVSKISHGVSYINGLLLIIIVAQVFFRYVMGRGYVALEELQWHFWAIGFLFGLSYCTALDANIRMDLFYRRMSSKTRAWLNILVITILVLPFIIIVIYYSWDFFLTSYRFAERSRAPLGLPYRWIIKGMITVSFALFGLGAVANLLGNIEKLRTKE